MVPIAAKSEEIEAEIHHPLFDIGVKPARDDVGALPSPREDVRILFRRRRRFITIDQGERTAVRSRPLFVEAGSRNGNRLNDHFKTPRAGLGLRR
jgi:hypothetical protein